MSPVDATRSGPVALVRAGDRALAVVVDADERALHTVDVATREQLAVTPLSDEPTHVLPLADGRLAVSFRRANRVAIVEPTADWRFEERCHAEVATEPIAMVERGDELLVVSGFGGALTGLSSDALSVRREIALVREPRAVVLSDDGDRAFVSHMVGGVLSSVDLRSERVVHADLRVGTVFKGFAFSDESRASNQGFALVSARGEDGTTRLFAPSVSVDTGDLSEPVSSGYGSPSISAPNPVSPVVMVLDAHRFRVLTHGLATGKNDAEVDCLLPRAAATNGARLWVACLGIDAVVELDARSAQPSLLEHRRFAMPSGPTGIVLDEVNERLVVWSEHVKQLSVVELESGEVLSTTLAHRTTPLLSAQLARGRELFHSTVDARISSDHRACASCHPDGRDDGLIWSSPDGKRQTKFLAGRLADSAPYGWFGEHATLHEHLRGTLRNLGGSGFDIDVPGAKEDFDALVAYIQAIPTPALREVEAEHLARGRAIYESKEQGCVSCHPDGATNGLAYDVGSRSPQERSGRFDTPSLRFVAGSAPYFHDGRYATLRALLSARDHQMGRAYELPGEDLIALETYLRTL